MAYKAASTALAAGQGVAVDGIHLNEWERHSAIQLYRQFGAKRAIGLVFDIDLELALERNKKRERRVEPSFIKQSYERLHNHMPTKAEGFDELYTIL